jgi:hypothetical protein
MLDIMTIVWAELFGLGFDLVSFRPLLVDGDGAIFEWGVCDHGIAGVQYCGAVAVVGSSCMMVLNTPSGRQIAPHNNGHLQLDKQSEINATIYPIPV